MSDQVLLTALISVIGTLVSVLVGLIGALRGNLLVPGAYLSDLKAAHKVELDRLNGLYRERIEEAYQQARMWERVADMERQRADVQASTVSKALDLAEMARQLWDAVNEARGK